MCYNLILKTMNVSKKQKKEIKNLLKEIFDEFKVNDDGAFLYNSLTSEIIKTLDYDEFKKKLNNLKIDDNTLLHMHLRKATSGSVSEQNIHGWRFENYICSHNGSYLNFDDDDEDYGKYYTYSKFYMDFKKSKSIKEKLDDNSDSYEFFNKNCRSNK